MEINQLSAASSVVAADQFVIYSSSNGDARKVSASVAKTFFQAGQTAADDKTTQYSAPSSTGFSVQITDASNSIWLILTPGATYATGTIVLPALANAIDKQEVLINCTQVVTTLTVDGNGATVTGEPAAFAANGYFRLRFDAATSVWYRVG